LCFIGTLLQVRSLDAGVTNFDQSISGPLVVKSWDEEYHLQNVGISPDKNLEITTENVDLLERELSFTPYDELSY